MSTSYGTITITNETEAKKAARYFLHSSGGSYVIAGTQNFNPSDESTYGYNTRIGTSEIQLRYNAIPLAEWGNNKLIFYDTTNVAIAQGSLNPLMSLTSDGLTFLKRGTNTSAAVLTGNGLEIKEGAISLGIIPSGETKHPFEVNSNGELYADNAYIKGVINATNGEFNGNINARSGKIGNWYILEGTSYVCQDDLIGEGGWTISTYNSEEQLQYYDSYGSISPRELIPTSIQIKFSGSLNGLNINDNNLYTYETPSLDTEYVIRYSNLDVAVVKVTFSGTYHTFYMTKILNDNIILEVWYYNYTIIDSDNGCLYYNNSTPGNSNSVVLSGKGKISSNSIAGSNTGLSWRMAVGNNFGVTTDGTLYASGANISGYINAGSGSIGGWKIGGDTAHSLWYSGNSSITTPAGALGNGLILSPGGIYSSTKPGSSTGLLPADKTWAFTAGDQFGVTTSGELYASGINLTNINVGTIAISDVDGLSSALSSAGASATYYIGGRWDPDYPNDSSKYGIALATSNPSSSSTKNFNFLNTDGMKIYKEISGNAVRVAQFGETVMLGPNIVGKNMIKIDNSGIYLGNIQNNNQFYSTAYFTQTESGMGDSEDYHLTLNNNGLTIYKPESERGETDGTMLTIATTPVYDDQDEITGYVGAIGNSYWDMASGASHQEYINFFDNDLNFFVGDGGWDTYRREVTIDFVANRKPSTHYGIYVNNEPVPVCFSGTGAPSPSIGRPGDIYIKYTTI